MRRSPVTLPTAYLRPIADQVASSGASVHAWLSAAGVAPSALDAVDLTVEAPVFRRLITSAVEAAREPALGLLVGERFVLSTHGIVGFAASNAATVRDALDVLVRFTGLRTSLVTVSYSVAGRAAHVRFDGAAALEPEVRAPVLEAVLLSIKNILEAITMGSCPVTDVAFPFPAPDYAAFAAELFACEVRYGQRWAGFSIAAAALDQPLPRSDRGAFEEAARICQRELDKLAASSSVAARVRRLLLEKQSGFPSLQATARLLHTTPRTLHRRLVDEGTSFRELVEEVRHTLAVEHLRSGRFRIEEIAFLLGYSDLSNFRRAFKRWESVPPTEYLAKGTPAPPRRAHGHARREAARR